MQFCASDVPFAGIRDAEFHYQIAGKDDATTLVHSRGRGSGNLARLGRPILICSIASVTNEECEKTLARAHNLSQDGTVSLLSAVTDRCCTVASRLVNPEVLE